jgi:hypothetical protein
VKSVRAFASSQASPNVVTDIVTGVQSSQFPKQKSSMDPTKFPVSAIPLNHTQYGPITDENLRGLNSGKVALVTGGARGECVIKSIGRIDPCRGSCRSIMLACVCPVDFSDFNVNVNASTDDPQL